MCVPVAATALTAMQVAGTVASAAGTLMAGIGQARAARANADAQRQRAEIEAQQTQLEDRRTRAQFRSDIATQSAELARRGVRLDSPTALLLGQEAARELSLASQDVRHRGSARQAELTLSERVYRREAQLGALRGGLSAAGTVLTAAPDLWPGLSGGGA